MSWEKEGTGGGYGGCNDGYGGGNDGYGGNSGGANLGACFNCGQEGHMKSDCPNPRVPRENSGECYNCGEIGHSKADCPNPTVAREFTGTCRLCNEQGHRAGDCPTAPPKTCKNCNQEGHTVTACTNPRKIDRTGIQVIEVEAAWNELLAAVEAQDKDDVQACFLKYVTACPTATYVDMETAFRSQNIPLYIIALEHTTIASTYTHMDLQGNLDKTYVVSLRLDPKPKRPKEALVWPASPAENLERLMDAGITVDRRIPKCSNCDELGHISKSCPQEKKEVTDRAVVQCVNCQEEGHRIRDCPKDREDRFACRNCKKSGHNSKECPEPKSAENVECKKCNEVGHFAKDCPTAGGGGGGGGCRNCGQEGHYAKDCTNAKVIICKNCDEEGHISKECPKPRDYSRVECSNCHKMGHTKVRCKEPIAEENYDNAGDGGYGGDDRGRGGFQSGGNNGGFQSGETDFKDFGAGPSALVNRPNGNGIGGGSTPEFKPSVPSASWGKGDSGGFATVNGSAGRGFGGGASSPVAAQGWGGGSSVAPTVAPVNTSTGWGGASAAPMAAPIPIRVAAPIPIRAAAPVAVPVASAAAVYDDDGW